jgi:hypothetical protein
MDFTKEQIIEAIAGAFIFISTLVGLPYFLLAFGLL